MASRLLTPWRHLGSALTAAPEASTWVMMLIGFAGLGIAGYRATRKGADATA
jgi:hypothetical protein